MRYARIYYAAADAADAVTAWLAYAYTECSALAGYAYAAAMLLATRCLHAQRVSRHGCHYYAARHCRACCHADFFHIAIADAIAKMFSLRQRADAADASLMPYTPTYALRAIYAMLPSSRHCRHAGHRCLH